MAKWTGSKLRYRSQNELLYKVIEDILGLIEVDDILDAILWCSIAENRKVATVEPNDKCFQRVQEFYQWCHTAMSRFRVLFLNFLIKQISPIQCLNALTLFPEAKFAKYIVYRHFWRSVRSLLHGRSAVWPRVI